MLDIYYHKDFFLAQYKSKSNIKIKNIQSSILEMAFGNAEANCNGHSMELYYQNS